MKKLTKKEETFAVALVENDNAIEAHKIAYPASVKWSYASIRASAHRVRNRPHVAARIEELKAWVKQIAEEEFGVTARTVLERLVAIDELDVLDILDEEGGLKPVRDWPKVWRQSITGMDVTELYSGSGDEKQAVGALKKIKWPDKLKNLELLGKHVDVQAFKEQTDHNHKVTLADFLDELPDAQ